MAMAATSEHLVRDDAAVAEVAAACRAAGELAFDLEFVSEGRMRPELGLVQVAWRAGDAVEVRAIDATACDPRPLLGLVGEDLPVIAHAARQDLQLLAARFDLKATHLFDTQIAAAFAGLGDQVGYGRLVEALLGARIVKDVQFTDWLARPLSPRQLAYALDDVRHLPEAADRLRARLAELGRAGWVAAEGAALAEVAFAAGRAGPEVAWRDVAGARKLRGLAREALVRLAAWRWRTALARNQPPSWVLADRVLVELAQRRPRDLAELGRVRGAGEVARRFAAEVLAELAAAGEVSAAAELAAAPAGGPRAQLWEEVFLALVQAAAEQTGIPARWIASRGECEELARLLDRGDPAAAAHPLRATWRREVVGDTLVAWTRGEVALAGDRSLASGVRVLALDREPG
jgi:ribonuclease D